MLIFWQKPSMNVIKYLSLHKFHTPVKVISSLVFNQHDLFLVYFFICLLWREKTVFRILKYVLDKRQLTVYYTSVGFFLF